MPLFKPFISRGDISNLPAYTFYAKLASLDAQEPMSGMTIVNTEIVMREGFDFIVRETRERYGYREE